MGIVQQLRVFLCVLTAGCVESSYRNTSLATTDLAARNRPENRLDRGATEASMRGMYVIINQKSLAPDTTESREFSHILRSENKIDELLQFANDHHFKRFSLYMKEVMASPGLSFALRSPLRHFIAKAHEHRIDVEIAMETPCALTPKWGAVDECGWVAAYQDHALAEEEKFDGFVTEYEFWNPSAAKTNDAALTRYRKYLELLESLKHLSTRHRRDGRSMSVHTYLGHLTAASEVSPIDKATDILSRADEVYLHCYVRDPSDAFGYCAQRLELFNAAANKLGRIVPISPIFSAEGKEDVSDSAEYFLGGWLNKQATASTALASAEATFVADYRPKRYTNLQIHGFQYFTYDLLREQLPHTRQLE